ncbi:MAG: hypothetical protein NTX00_04645 [Candidatus Parcubacteria bacterium]|nr:hypothetical protein [Candidatus Parcubacteria bacterium]
MTENNQNYLTQKQFHEGLAEFTEETLLPAMEKMLDEKLEPIKQKLHSIELEIEDIKIAIERIDKRSDEDVKGIYFEIEKLKNRIGELEQQVKLLKTERA